MHEVKLLKKLTFLDKSSCSVILGAPWLEEVVTALPSLRHLDGEATA